MAAPPGSVLPLEHLEQAAAAARDFAGLLASQLEEAGALERSVFSARLYERVVAPVEEALLSYADRELSFLTAELLQLVRQACARAEAAVRGDPAGEGPAATLGGALPPAASALAAALSRCLRLTGGTGLPALARVTDRAASQFVGALEAGMASLRGGGGAASDLDAAEEAAPLLTIAAQLVSLLAEAEAGLRSAAAETAPRLLAAAGSGGEAPFAPDGLPAAAVLRLRSQPSVLQQLSSMAAAVGADSPANLLPLASAAAVELERGVGAHVEAVLTARVRQAMAGLAALPEWRQRAGALPLPTFSAYPLQYVTSGEGVT